MVDMSGLTTVADVARRQSFLRGDQIALRSDGRATTFGEIDAQASQVAQKLLSSGLGPQDRIAYLAKNDERFFAFLFGAAKARMTLAPINFRLAAPEIAYIVEDCAAKLFVVGADFADIALKAVSALASKPRLVALDFDRPGFERLEDWLGASPAHDPLSPIGVDDDLIQLYTSGTTGYPKGVRLTHRNYLTLLSLVGKADGLNYAVGDTVLGAMPFFHVAGVNIALVTMASGARTAIVRDILPDAILDLIRAERVNHAFLAPAIIGMLMASPKMPTADLSSMKTLSYGASPIAEDLLRRAQARFQCRFIQFYGMTETTGAATYLPSAAHDPVLGKLRSCGIAWPEIEVRIIDAGGRDVPVGEVGEIVVRSPVVMKGYWNKPEASAAAISDGWMRTGDAAYADADGYFFIYDRVKDMIVTGGENVYPAEVENAIAGHPDVADVAVIGVPDEKWGEVVKAIVVAKPGSPKNAASVIARAREKIAGYKAPKSVDFVDAIPRNITGKILRRELRAPYWQGRERKVN